MENITQKFGNLLINTDNGTEQTVTIDQLINGLPNKKWIKQLILEDELELEEFIFSVQFIKVADIVLDNETKKNGEQKRNTVIRFTPTISKKLWEFNDEWIYIMTMNNRIIKIGGTRNGLKSRCSSYLCGHHTVERGKSGKCSVTNAKVYNTFEFYLNHIENVNLELYGYQLPVSTKNYDIWGENVEIIVQTYHKYESMLLQKYKKQNGKFPVLSDNADPNV